MRLTVTILLSFIVGLLTSGCSPKQECIPQVIIKPMKIPQVPYPAITNNQYDNCLDYSKQCTINYFMMKEAFTECSTNAKIGQ